MSTTTYYDRVIAPMPEGIERSVMTILAEHIGEEKRISLEALTFAVMGNHSVSNERKVRQAVENLRLQGVPIMSESGKSGRWLAKDENERAAVVREFEARAANLQKVISALRSATIPYAGEQPVQERLW